VGLSIPVVSGIMLVALTIFTSLLLHTMIMEAQALTQAISGYAAKEVDRLGVMLELNIVSIDAASGVVNFTLRNTGSKTIFLQERGSIRNDVIVACNTSGNVWSSQLVSYEVLEVKITNTDVEFDPVAHPYLNPGEEALIRITVSGLRSGSIVVVTFVSHYGMTAQAEGVVP